MMKHYTLKCKRYAVAIVLAVLAVLSVSAGDNKYYYFYATAKANPTGQGKVYLTKSQQDNTPVYEEETEIKFTSDIVGISTATVWGYAEPADGYLLAGWSKGTDAVEVYGNPGALSVEASASTEEGQEPDEFGYPFEPDAEWNALFTRVMVSYVPGQATLGEISCSKVCNEIGDEVVLTAVPAENCRFTYWTLNGERLTDNPLKVTVSGPANYIAHFESEFAMNLTFPEEGGYIPFSHATMTVLVPEGMTVHSIMCDSLEDNPVLSADKIRTYESAYQLVAGDAALLYAVGECTLLMEDPGEYTYFSQNNLLKSSGANGVNIAEIAEEGHRYFIFEDDKFVHTTDATVAPNSLYLAIPDSCGQTADVLTIVTGSEYADGIDDVFADGKNAGKEVKVEGIYDLAGRRVALPGKDGIYIIDGKKVLFRKK